MFLIAACFVTAAIAQTQPATGLTAADPAQMRRWIEEMKTAERGPFSRIRWFCQDGAVLDPVPFACETHGGGAQHGEWTQRTKTLRENGYLVANILEDLDVDAFLQPPEGAGVPVRDAVNQLLFEQFLIGHDDGWIYRKARYYRGAIQAEGESRGARRLLLAMLKTPAWTTHDYLVLRTAARLLPHEVSRASIAEVRELSAALAEKDPGFVPLRNKIHNRPEAGDAALVRDYAKRLNDPAQEQAYETLAATIDAAYSAGNVTEAYERLYQGIKAPADLRQDLQDGLASLQQATTTADRFAVTAVQLAHLRDLWPRFERPETRLAALYASLALEDACYAAATQLQPALRGASRRQQLAWLTTSAAATYGAGLISAREIAAVRADLSPLTGETVRLRAYKQALDYAALVPGWGTQWLRFYFQQSADKFSAIEPRIGLFIQDQLRSSALFFFAQVIDSLLRDANGLSGVTQSVFGEQVGGGMRALNPGLARGTLHIVQGDIHPEQIRSDGIYLLPETISELPPVAGILTEGAGNPLSHVQLLARNLGIPNVAVDGSLVERLKRYDGRKVILAASPGGAVQLMEDTPQAEAMLGDSSDAREATDVLIKVDVNKLKLGVRDFIPLSQLRAGDSGRVVGPKAAKLGELKAHFPDAVADGLAIPFGAFRHLLDQPKDDGGKSVFEWMTGEYARLAAMPAGKQKNEATEMFRKELESWVLNHGPDADFRARLRAAMEKTFGPDGSYGVFVRSDTNVEDLGGFTGAGLNLTLPNVVGFDKVIDAITRVWASPFSARSFAWRQSRMDRPEHVYPAILLLRSVNNEKSGVMVTRDIDSGDPGVLSVAVNEGVGGAVDGQAAESLRIDLATGKVRLLAQATVPTRRILPPEGGIREVPVSGDDTVLKPGEIAQLIQLARELPTRFPPIVDGEGKPAAADIEFGFVAGKLQLFQIRPVNESHRARGSEYLKSLDREQHISADAMVPLAAAPGA